MKLTMRWIMALASLMLLAGVTPARAATSIFSTSLGTLDGNKAGPKVTSLTKQEGGDETQRSGVLFKINATTVIILSPGDDRAFGTADDGVWHCIKLGSSGQTCEFLSTGALFERRPIQVNATTAVVLGMGEDEAQCESASEDTGNPDDQLIVLRKLGSTAATVEFVDGSGLAAGGFCFGAIASDPIRINNTTILFNQPGENLDYADTNQDDTPASQCPSANDPDDTVVMARIGTSSTRVTERDVGALLGVHLTGAPASLPVRVSDSMAVIASPGEDSQFADGSDGCDAADDGLVVVKGLTGSSPTVSFIEIGSLAANPANRPVLVNPGIAVAVLGTGPSQKQQEEELEDHSCCGLPVDPDDASDDEIHIVSNLGGAGTITTFSGFGFFRGQPHVLNNTTILAFEEDHSLARTEGGSFQEDLVRLNVHRINQIGGAAKLTSMAMPNGDAFHRLHHFSENVAVTMNPNQALFHVTGPPQLYLFNNGASPFLTVAPGNADEWAEVKVTRLSDYIAGYTRAMQGGVGACRIGYAGKLECRLVTLSGEGDDGNVRGGDWGLNQPASEPVAISPYRFVVAQGGSNNTFADDTNDALNGHDDGFISINTYPWPPKFRFVTVRNSCGGPGCRPLALGTASAPIVAILGVGDNGEFDNDGDEEDDDDEINVIKGF